MLVGFFTSGYMMLFADVGWLIGPLTGCAVSSACYVGISLLHRQPSGQSQRA
jgi:sodium/pantothenate symporter